MLVEPINATAALTVAKARAGKLLTKTHTRVGDKWTTQPYAKAYRYDLHLVHLKGIPELYSLLERLQGANDACLMPREIHPDQRAESVRRAICDGEPDQQPPDRPIFGISQMLRIKRQISTKTDSIEGDLVLNKI